MAAGDRELKKALLDYLESPRTHAPFEAAVKDFPVALINKKLPGVPYTPWMLVEHIRRSQHDMVDFIRNKDYEGMEWPKDYWPDIKEKADKRMWAASATAFKKDAATLRAILKKPRTDLFAKIPWGEGQTVFREVMQIIDHNAYHIGELVLLRRAMGDWG